MKEHLNESTVRSWVSTYKREVECKRKSEEDDLQVKVLPLAKRGRPLLFGETLDNQEKAYIRAHRAKGGPVTSLIVIAVGRAIVRKYDPNYWLRMAVLCH